MKYDHRKTNNVPTGHNPVPIQKSIPTYQKYLLLTYLQYNKNSNNIPNETNIDIPCNQDQSSSNDIPLKLNIAIPSNPKKINLYRHTSTNNYRYTFNSENQSQ